MRTPEQITLANGRTLADVLADHRRWQLGDSTGSGADLRGADLRGAVLSGAVLRDAALRGADLRGAVLRDADLSDADLSDADLRGAALRGADLRGADLRGAVLSDAVLSDADLREIREDVRALANEYGTAEVQGLIRALHLGRVNGTCYQPECGMACLVGTIAICKGVDADDLSQNASRFAERWAMAIRPGDSAPHNQIATLTAEWLTSALVERPDYDKVHPFGAHRGVNSATAAELESFALELLANADRIR